MGISEEPGPFWLRVQGLDCAADSNKISSPCLHPPTKTQGPTRKHPCPTALPLRSKDNLGQKTASVTPVRGAWCSDLGPRTSGLGSGKVAGKVLIVDLWARFAKMLI